MKLKHADLERAAAIARQKLLSELSPNSHWIGQLSSSALSTATAVCALQVLLNNNGSRNSSNSTPSEATHTLVQSPGLLPSPPGRGKDEGIPPAENKINRPQKFTCPPHKTQTQLFPEPDPHPTILPSDGRGSQKHLEVHESDVQNLGSGEYLFPDTDLINRGLAWLAANQNSDGGWGDTVLSFSNISTSALCWAAFGAVPGADAKHRNIVEKVEAYLIQKAGGISPDQLAAAIIQRYGKDRTFSVPILTMCAISGRLGNNRAAWQHVIPLPFEIAALPHKLFAILRMPVVSYALPALIAIGQARHVQAPSRNPIARILRSLSRQKTLRVLEGIQPRSGGFLEATPLTSFVCMSLGASGQSGSQVAKAGAQFLRASVLPDGSWPIDTNLATWATTLAVQALGSEGIQDLNSAQRSQLLRWFLDQQYKTIHPYTQAAPGGWAWTNLSGGVPDADDTSSALLALAELDPSGKETSSAATAGAEWLLGLQNGDGGIPTFCRGWTHLPFDQSSPDITAHAIRAWMAWQLKLPASLQKRVAIALKQATDYLLKAQQSDGSWIPLWFGNQHEPEEENRTYGVCKVLQGLLAIGRAGPPQVAKAIRNGIAYLVRTQSSSGGWSGGFSSHVSVEETALTVETLGKLQTAGQLTPEAATALDDGLDWLVRKVLSDDWTTPSSIGFYFAKLWYYERLYPIIFTTGALQQARARLLPGSSLASHASPP